VVFPGRKLPSLAVDKLIGRQGPETLQNFAAYENNTDYPAFTEEDSSNLVDHTDSEDSKSSAMDASEVRLLAQLAVAPLHIRLFCLAADLKERLSVSTRNERNAFHAILGNIGWPLLVGAATCSLFYACVYRGPLNLPAFHRYFATHPVAFFATGMFFVGIAALYEDSMADISSDEIFGSGGVGMRYVLHEESRLNFRIDYAWGEGDEEGLYVGVREAF
jgi:hypothetical protein